MNNMPTPYIHGFFWPLFWFASLWAGMGEGRKYVGGKEVWERNGSMWEESKYGGGKEVCEEGIVMCIFVRKCWYGCIGR